MRFFIVGFGKFGKLSLARLEVAFPDSKITVIDPRAQDEDRDIRSGVTIVRAEAVSFLVGYDDLSETDWIIPMVPFHLAASLILAHLPGTRVGDIPAQVVSIVPNPYQLDPSCVCCSLADFVCPDACPEGPLCSVTGKAREPLYVTFGQMVITGFNIGLLRSRQILPGIGGYQARDLVATAELVKPGKNLVVTACKCHGILTAIDRKK